MTKIRKSLFGDKTDIELGFFARASCGFNGDKNYATYLDNRDCGKGVIYELLKMSLEEYVKPFALGNVFRGRETQITPQEVQEK